MYGEKSNLVRSLKLDTQFISQMVAEASCYVTGYSDREGKEDAEHSYLRLFKRILKVFEILLIITMNNVY